MSFIKKIFRFFGYLLLFIGLGYQTQRLYKKLKVEPEIFSKESSIQSSEIPFPAVTVCPSYTVKNEAWNKEFLKLNNLTENDLRAAFLLTCKEDFEVIRKYQFDDTNQVDIMLKASPNFWDFFNRCGINNYFADNLDCDRIFIKSMTNKGICVTFNMIGHQSIFKEVISSNFDIYKRTKITKSWTFEDTMNESHHDDINDPQPSIWSLETGYLSDFDNVQPVRALKMQMLTVQTNSLMNQTLCEGRENIFKIILHLPNEVPQLSFDAVDYPIGKEEVVLVSAEVIHNEDSLRVFPPETRGCYFDGEKHLRFFKSYTEANCEYECLINLTYKICGCVKFWMVRTDKMTVCKVLRGCTEDVVVNFPRSYYKDPENKKRYPHYPCGCLPSCTKIKYKVLKHIQNDNDLAESYRYALFDIVFGDSQIKKTSNYVTYEMENFIFDIGGLIGLFLGSSILSVLELIVSILKAIKSHTKEAIKWFKPRSTIETVEPELQATDGIESSIDDESRPFSGDNISTMTMNSLQMRVFAITGLPDASLRSQTVQFDDISLEDLEN
ncbi:unnamed protein product [Chironomus riparius]|uniref:Uncharacterized protein n=1 Tax=Chironomus riparius TaxID=315576 RepID=A0A9N9S7S5_9DIPT|nr:unnamed protein product [Chironomus riparius]